MLPMLSDETLDYLLANAGLTLTAEQKAIPRWDVFANPSFTMPFNVSGYPAIAVCSGFGPAGLPASLQMAGKPFQGATVLQVADAFEKATGFRAQRPAMAA